MTTNLAHIVSSAWLAEHLSDPRLRLIDASTFLSVPTPDRPAGVWSGRSAYEEAHIPGAVFADMLHAFSDAKAALPFTAPSREQFIREIEKLGVGDGTYVVIYDRGALANSQSAVASHWASRLRWLLKYEGFDQVAVLEGGLQRWQQEGRAVCQHACSYPKACFSGQRQTHLLVSKDEVKALLESPDVVLINSLSAADFYGKTLSYGRAGRIPGSQHLYFGQHCDPLTRLLKPIAELRAAIAPTGALEHNKRVVIYCGAGIAATWNALLLNLLGQENVTVYDGSLSEWARDSSCPLIS